MGFGEKRGRSGERHSPLTCAWAAHSRDQGANESSRALHGSVKPFSVRAGEGGTCGSRSPQLRLAQREEGGPPTLGTHVGYQSPPVGERRVPGGIRSWASEASAKGTGCRWRARSA